MLKLFSFGYASHLIFGTCMGFLTVAVAKRLWRSRRVEQVTYPSQSIVTFEAQRWLNLMDAIATWVLKFVALALISLVLTVIVCIGGPR